MNQDQLYRLSCQAARDLLEDLDGGNVARMKQHLTAIRHYMDLAEILPVEKLRGEALYRREQMEVLAGVAEHLSGALEHAASALERARESLAARFESLSVYRDLLRHVASAEAVSGLSRCGPKRAAELRLGLRPQPVQTPQCAATGCTLPASPSA